MKLSRILLLPALAILYFSLGCVVPVHEGDHGRDWHDHEREHEHEHEHDHF